LRLAKKITFKPKKIEWNVLNFKKSVATYKIKGKDLKIEAYFDDVCIGSMATAYEEIFIFLLQMKYITIKGTALTSPAMNSNRKFEVRIDIFLTEWVILNPLNSMAPQPRRKAVDTPKENEKESNKSKTISEKIEDLLGTEKKQKVVKKKKEEELSEEEQKNAASLSLC